MLLYCCDYTPLYTVMWVMCGRCAGSVRVNGMIMTGLPCGKAGHNHDNITLYSCDRPRPIVPGREFASNHNDAQRHCGAPLPLLWAQICPGENVNRLTFLPGQKSLSRYAISAHF